MARLVIDLEQRRPHRAPALRPTMRPQPVIEAEVRRLEHRRGAAIRVQRRDVLSANLVARRTEHVDPHRTEPRLAGPGDDDPGHRACRLRMYVDDEIMLMPTSGVGVAKHPSAGPGEVA